MIRLPVIISNKTLISRMQDTISHGSLTKMHLPLLLLLLSHCTCSPSTLESLLSTHLDDATCSVRCSSQAGEQTDQCREVCSLLLSSPTSPLCTLIHLCGAGCRSACFPPPPQPVSLSPHLSPCSLSWLLSSPLPTLVLLAGQDHGDKWHLVASSNTSTFPRALLRSYSRVSMFAVGASGVVARAGVDLSQEGEDCVQEHLPPAIQEHLPPAQDYLFSPRVRGVLYLAVPSTLALLALLLLVSSLLRPGDQAQPVLTSYYGLLAYTPSLQPGETSLRPVLPSYYSMLAYRPPLQPGNTNIDPTYEEIGQPFQPNINIVTKK